MSTDRPSPFVRPRRRPVPRLIRAGAVAVGFLAAIALPSVHAAPAAQQPPTIPKGRLSSCGAAVSAAVSTDELRMCDPATVTVSVAPFCATCTAVDIVVVVEDTPHLDWERAVMERTLDEINRRSRQANLTVRIGMVRYNGQMVRRILAMAPGNVGAARAKLNDIANAHDPRGLFLEAGQEGLAMLRESRRSRAKGSEDCEFVIYFAYTKNYMADKGQEMIQAGQLFHREKIPFFFGCPHRHPEECVSAEPKTPKSLRYFTKPEDLSKLPGMVRGWYDEREGRNDNELKVRRLELHQVIPSGLDLIAASASQAPAAADRTADGTHVAWQWDRLRPLEPLTITYRVTPTEAGRYGLDGWTLLTDMDNHQAMTVTHAGAITVTHRSCLPAPTPTAFPTPTDTPPPPTATPVPTPTPAPPTATATRAPRPIYLPLTVREPSCDDIVRHADVVLIIDMSTSMDRLSEDGAQKKAAVITAAKVFVDRLDLSPDAQGRLDQAAVVGFNNDAWIQSKLTSDAGSLKAALDSLDEKQKEGTRLDLAFLKGAEALDPLLRRPDNLAVLVMLTDGLPNRVPFDPESGRMEETVIKAAQVAKDIGATIYTIGFGHADAPDIIDRVYPWLLEQCATTPSMAFVEPRADRLAGIYSGIADVFTCPTGRHDWSQPWP